MILLSPTSLATATVQLLKGRFKALISHSGWAAILFRFWFNSVFFELIRLRVCEPNEIQSSKTLFYFNV